MGNKLKWPHMILARFTVSTFTRMQTLAKSSKESVAEFIRVAVQHEIELRENAGSKEREQ